MMLRLQFNIIVKEDRGKKRLHYEVFLTGLHQMDIVEYCYC